VTVAKNGNSVVCLGISAEVYDTLVENKEICWFCTSFSGKH